MTAPILPALKKYIEHNLVNATIPEDRKILLRSLADYIQNKIDRNEVINLIFVCTHNSRRSHISQLWAQVAGYYFDIQNVNCFSGGTEATAFNPRAVKAMQEAGFAIEALDKNDNPRYKVIFSEHTQPMLVFSKAYDQAPNPTKNFAAIMTCSHADENCPFIPGVEKRIALTYNDPKDFDNTSLEITKYAERVKEIGSEIFYAFSLVKHR